MQISIFWIYLYFKNDQKLSEFVMLRPMFGYRPKAKRFEYQFRYHDPKEEEKRKRRIRIQTHNRRKPKQVQKVFGLAALLFMVVWIISKL